MVKKILFIAFIGTILTIYLFNNPFYKKPSNTCDLIDRLPNTNYKGKIDILRFAKEIQLNLKEIDFKYRDLFAPDFILGQAKNIGVNIQNPVYIFGENEVDWGLIAQVSDLKKMKAGVERICKIFPFRDTIISKTKVLYNPKSKIHLYYDESFILFYLGTTPSKIIKRVINKKNEKIYQSWKSFLDKHEKTNEYFILSNKSTNVESIGFNELILSHQFDSSNFMLKANIGRNDPINLKIKKEGLSIKQNKKTEFYTNIHLDISKFRENIDEELLEVIRRYTKKINFPVNTFLKAWDGDLCFVKGGQTTVKEKYIETVIDDNFNTQEITKINYKKVPAFSILISLNKNKNRLIGLLLKKGLLRKEKNNIYYFLFSPPLKIKKIDNYLLFYSGDNYPQTIEKNDNELMFEYKSNDIKFTLDSIYENRAFGSFSVLLDSLSKPSKLF